jgi:hypothetical protein
MTPPQHHDARSDRSALVHRSGHAVGYASAFGVVLTQSDGKSSAINVPRLRLFKPMILLKLRGSVDVESVKGMKHVSAVLLLAAMAANVQAHDASTAQTVFLSLP